MTVKELKTHQAEVGKYLLKTNDYIHDHGAVEVPETDMVNIRQLLRNYFDFIDAVINKTEVI